MSGSSTAQKTAATQRGLSTDAASALLRSRGYNELPDRERLSIWRTVRTVLTEPMFLLLVAAAAVYLIIGDLAEGLMLAFFALMTVSLVVIQDRRSERALDALRALAAPRARVMRDGREQNIAAHEVVPGDALLLAEGERIPADGVVRSASGFTVDEALLTGEGVPVRKLACADDAPGLDSRPGGDDRPYVYASTMVVSGHAVAEVLATGIHTRSGAIGASLAVIESEPTLLEGALQRLVRIFGAIAIALSVLIALWYGMRLDDWTQGILSGIALGMAMLPEEFPMALAVLLALGAWRLARVHVLARRPAVIETLGAITVLCTDKTGTLTENRMHVHSLMEGSQLLEAADWNEGLPAAFHRVLDCASLASRRAGIDPMDNAITSLADGALPCSAYDRSAWHLEREYGLTPQLPALTQVWLNDAGDHIAAAKGAPEAIARLCRLDAEATRQLLNDVERMARRGLRVLAVATGRCAGFLPDRPQDLELSLVGLVALVDPLRAQARLAVTEAHQAGISVVMITGDYPATALAIAREAGIDTSAGVLTGEQIEKLDNSQLGAAVRSTCVYARVMPEQKLRLVQAFKANGEVVAMTGDGVNDAPALKAAHIGIAMGVRGTDVAREASDIVLLDEDFGRIVASVRMGRRIYDNLRKVMTYITAIHVPIIGVALLPLLLGMPPLMLPVHVVLTEMVIDPICAIAFESAPETDGIMNRKPRSSKETLIGLPLLAWGFVQGLVILCVTFALYWFALKRGMTADVGRTLAIVGLTAGNLMLVWLNAAQGVAWRRLLSLELRAFWLIAAAASAAMIAAISVPPLRAMLRFDVPSVNALLAAIVIEAAGIGLLWLIRGAGSGMRGSSVAPGNKGINATT